MKSLLCLVVASAFLTLFSGCATHSHQHGSGHTHEKWIPLFDGTSTDAWRGFKRDSFPDKAWTVSNGALKTIVGGEVIDLITKDQFDNFELRLDWKSAPGANSGVIYRVAEDLKNSWHTGPEMQILDDSKHADGKNPKTSAGALYALIAPQNKKLSPVGEWNTMRLLVHGNHVEHWLNGIKVVEYELNSPALKELVAQSKFKDLPRFAKEPTGHICLQHHRDEVWFRNVKIRKL